MQHTQAEAMKTSSQLRDKWNEAHSKNLLEWKTKIYEAKLEEVNERRRREQEQHKIEIDILQ